MSGVLAGAEMEIPAGHIGLHVPLPRMALGQRTASGRAAVPPLQGTDKARQNRRAEEEKTQAESFRVLHIQNCSLIRQSGGAGMSL